MCGSSIAAAILEAADGADRGLAAFEVGHGVAADGAGHLAVIGIRLRFFLALSLLMLCWHRPRQISFHRYPSLPDVAASDMLGSELLEQLHLLWRWLSFDDTEIPWPQVDVWFANEHITQA